MADDQIKFEEEETENAVRKKPQKKEAKPEWVENNPLPSIVYNGKAPVRCETRDDLRRAYKNGCHDFPAPE